MKWVSPSRLSLPPQIRIELLGFAKQVRDVLVGRLNQTLKLSKLVLKLLTELALLLVTPSLFELVHLGREGPTALTQFLGELRQLGRELSNLIRVADGLVHAVLPVSGFVLSAWIAARVDRYNSSVAVSP